MATKYCVIRTDMMSGTVQPTDTVSFRFYDANGKAAEVENGVIVKLGGYDDGQYQIFKATAAAAGDDLNECAIAAGVEVMYDERVTNLDQFVNEEGVPVRGYIPRSRNEFSITKEGFVGGTVPAVGDPVGIGAAGKVDADGTGLGTCVHIDITNRYTYYTIQIGKTETTPAADETVVPGGNE